MRGFRVLGCPSVVLTHAGLGTPKHPLTPFWSMSPIWMLTLLCVVSPLPMQASAPVYRTEWHALVGRSWLPYTQLGRVTLHSGCQPDHQRVQHGRESRHRHLHPVSHLQRLGMWCMIARQNHSCLHTYKGLHIMELNLQALSQHRTTYKDISLRLSWTHDHLHDESFVCGDFMLNLSSVPKKKQSKRKKKNTQKPTQDLQEEETLISPPLLHYFC